MIDSRNLRTVSLIISLAGYMLCLPQAGAGDTQSPNDSKQLVDAFLLSSSSQSQYAKDLDERTFYVQLHVTNLRPDLKDTKCVDTSFISWVRKFFRDRK